jgi:hypothetical protein
MSRNQKILKRKISEITEKVKSDEELTDEEVNLGLSLLFGITFQAHREEWAKGLAFKNGRWRQDVYDGFMTDDPDDPPITMEIPNLFTWKEENEKFIADLNRRITYTCPNCKCDIERYPESRKNCPLCNAPYGYDPKKVYEQMSKGEKPVFEQGTPSTDLRSETDSKPLDIDEEDW